MFRSLSVNPALNGFIVTIGCQTLVYQDKQELIDDLEAYLNNPNKTEEKILKKSYNKEFTAPGLGAMAQVDCNQAETPRIPAQTPIRTR